MLFRFFKFISLSRGGAGYCMGLFSEGVFVLCLGSCSTCTAIVYRQQVQLWRMHSICAGRGECWSSRCFAFVVADGQVAERRVVFLLFFLLLYLNGCAVQSGFPWGAFSLVIVNVFCVFGYAAYFRVIVGAYAI